MKNTSIHLFVVGGAERDQDEEQRHICDSERHSMNDAGRYRCYVGKTGSPPELISNITLKVEVQNIRADPGQTVTLPCRAPRDTNIIVVEWTRPDLRTDYVLLNRDERPDPENQHSSFQNRVELVDRQMKDGDVSLILKDVTSNDTGTYECRVVQRKTNRRKRSYLKTEPINIIYLDVRGNRDTGRREETRRMEKQMETTVLD
ncbi:coxsackievirus and adenovirus receptor homolog [Lates japonicus]|uniref:Coxsackievirus and adenovirus receptor homolog n=1 Tax=Lates japonicus TaxID=270547 RepID=A0AAD3MY52_LATJO|nr:coxsackievirus and adenovirus receptor homolog [Lates japonicus]